MLTVCSHLSGRGVAFEWYRSTLVCDVAKVMWSGTYISYQAYLSVFSTATKKVASYPGTHISTTDSGKPGNEATKKAWAHIGVQGHLHVHTSLCVLSVMDMANSRPGPQHCRWKILDSEGVWIVRGEREGRTLSCDMYYMRVWWSRQPIVLCPCTSNDF